MTSVLIAADVLVTGEQVLRPGWLLAEGPRVAALGGGAPPRPADVTGALAVPGFVDMHVHGGGGAAFTQATDEAVDTAVDLHRRHGTTAMVASLVSAHEDDLVRQVRALAPHVRAGRLAGIHLEGPWISHLRCGAHEPATLRAPERGELERVFAAADGTIAMVTLAPELPGGLEAVRWVRQAGAIAAVGHTDATYEQARAAIDAGARVATHLFNAMRPVHHREPGPVIALREDPRVTVEMITDGIHVHPALYRDTLARVGDDRLAIVTDAMAAAGMSDGAYRLGALAVDVRDGVATVAGTDTIAGSTATMDHVFGFAVAHGDPDPDRALLAAVRATSVNPARTLGLPDVALTVGAAADVVLLDARRRVTGVLRAGAWARGDVHTP